MELRQHLGLLEIDVTARHLQMNVGRVEKHWEKNCVAVGLAQGFIEPLEATALALSFNTLSAFIKCYEKGGYSNQFEDAFNNEINARFDGVRDYIVCHYKVNQRRDTPYWKDNAANTHLSETLAQIIHFWHRGGDFAKNLYMNNLVGSYQPKSWACLLAGYGVFPPLRSDEHSAPAPSLPDMVQLGDFIRRCGLNFSAHNQLLDHIHRRP
jgi:hypothetical protein